MNESCPTCGMDGVHDSSTDCIRSLQVTMQRMAERLDTLDHRVDLLGERDWVRRTFIDYTVASIDQQGANRLRHYLAKEEDPAILTLLFEKGKNRTVFEIATRHAAPSLWTQPNLRRALPAGLPVLASRGLIPREMLNEQQLREWIRPDDGSGYRNSYFSGVDVAQPIEGLLAGGYEIPEKLQKEVARLAGRPFEANEREHLRLGLAALRLPAISAGNIRNIVNAHMEAISTLSDARLLPYFEPLFHVALSHELVPASLASTMATETAPAPALRALAAIERWRSVPEIRSVLVASHDGQVALHMLEDVTLTREEFAVLFERAAAQEPVETLALLEREPLPLLRTEDLAPLLTASEQQVRVGAMTRLSALRDVAVERSPGRSR